jgi:hypothetical protein
MLLNKKQRSAMPKRTLYECQYCNSCAIAKQKPLLMRKQTEKRKISKGETRCYFLQEMETETKVYAEILTKRRLQRSGCRNWWNQLKRSIIVN